MEDKYIEDFVSNEYETVLFCNNRIVIVNSDDELDDDDELVEFDPEDYIEEHSYQLNAMYKDMCEMYNLCTFASYSDFCEYMVYCRNTDEKNIDEWREHFGDFEYKLYGLSNPNKNEFTAHYLREILDMYCYLLRNYTLHMGKMKDFIDYCYIYSDHVLR